MSPLPSQTGRREELLMYDARIVIRDDQLREYQAVPDKIVDWKNPNTATTARLLDRRPYDPDFTDRLLTRSEVPAPWTWRFAD